MSSSFVKANDDVTKITFLRRKGFVCVGKLGELFETGLPKLGELDSCGVYAVTIPVGYRVGFISPERAKERNVIMPWPIERLHNKWVEEVEVVYYGRAQGKSKPRSLRKRLRDLIRHGSGQITSSGPHKGGEILWQLEDYDEFSVWIYPTGNLPAPKNTERQLIDCFCQGVGKLPFANRRRELG